MLDDDTESEEEPLEMTVVAAEEPRKRPRRQARRPNEDRDIDEDFLQDSDVHEVSDHDSDSDFEGSKAASDSSSE